MVANRANPAVITRMMFTYKSNMWYLEDQQSTFGYLALSHLDKIHKILKQYVVVEGGQPRFDGI